jgi:hypothetical protein
MKHLGPIIEERQGFIRQHGKECAELPVRPTALSIRIVEVESDRSRTTC